MYMEKRKKNIYVRAAALLLAASTAASCSDWLDVYPSDEIKEEYLFSTGDGYRTALNGIYRKMTTFNLYGSNLTWGLVDAWAQSYYIDQAPQKGGGEAMQLIADLEFKDQNLTPTTDALWEEAWNVVANCNNLAQQAAVADSSLFRAGEYERRMIEGEALGLRAYMQFDLLRIYAPAPASRNYAEDPRTFIPYVDTYPSYVNPHRTVAECLELAIRDLKRAQELLKPIDENENMDMDRRYQVSTSYDQHLFFEYRGYRLNYWAVTAELARVYLYAGMEEEAYAEAMKLIKEEEETGYFKGSTSSYDIEENGNIKLLENVIFALYSPTELVEWERTINYYSDGYMEYYLCMDSEVANQLYGNDAETDWRMVYQLEPMYYGYYYRPLKYHELPSSKSFAEDTNPTIPMLRMSEVYYIAAEAIFDTNPEEAKSYLQLVKRMRGVRNTDYTTVSNKNEFVELLLNDMRREFFGEGQILYQYKRLNHTIPAMSSYDDPVLPTDENVVLPLPDSEMNING